MNASDPDKILTKTLHAWRVQPTREPAFKGQVWRWIAARQSSWPGYLRAHAPMAVGALALAVFLGGWSGHAHARYQATVQRDVMVNSYVQSLDARVMADQP